MSSKDVDLTMMMISHDAFRRDLGQLTRAAEKNTAGDPARRAAVLAGWAQFKIHLHNHHVNEDKSIWPQMRRALADRPDDLAILDTMVADHERIDPLLAAVDAAFGETEPKPDALTEAIETLRTELSGHLGREEREALPLVPEAISAEDWKQAMNDMRDLVGLKGAADFFPWLLDGASESEVEQVLKLMPLPARFMYRKMWLPAYTKAGYWG